MGSDRQIPAENMALLKLLPLPHPVSTSPFLLRALPPSTPCTEPLHQALLSGNRT